jgi:S1-C subfamily serine protease
VFNDAITKYSDMVDPVVHIYRGGKHGSGIIIHRQFMPDSKIYIYLVVTNYHVIDRDRYKVLSKIDGITGKEIYRLFHITPRITVFQEQTSKWHTYESKVAIQDPSKDLAVLRFQSETKYPIACLASQAMLDEIQVFDRVYAIGCQLGEKPSPTTGIISGIIETNNFSGFLSSAEIAPGSSGGGLFRKFNDHYYLIGISCRTGRFYGRFVSHLAYSISVEVLNRLLIENSVIEK